MKIPQDVLKMISGHVVAKKWCAKNAVSIANNVPENCS